jgi:murein DD-endopeptidase MepM/ murein hydrolase activator NlpD
MGTLVLVMALTVGVAVPTEWSPPVDGPVRRGFDAPAAAWEAGHRGVDFEAPPGTPVRSAGPGRVAFAGSVAGGLHVTVAHAGGVRTSYSYLSRLSVEEGATVERGHVLGLSGGTGPGHPAGVVHFGVRIGARYVDPATLAGLPPVQISLAPLDGGGPPRCAPPGRAPGSGGYTERQPGHRLGILTPASHR